MTTSEHRTQAEESDAGHPQRWRILAVMCASLVLIVASVSSLNLAIPSIIVALQPTATETLWIVDAYVLVFAGLLLPAGALGDRYGRKWTLLIGIAVFVIGAPLAAWANTPLMLIAGRAIMGIGAALIMPSTLSIIIAVFSSQERAKAIATWAGFAGAGGAIGVLAGGGLLEFFWWGSVFFINLPVAIAAGALIMWLVPNSKDENATPLDPVGAALSIIGLGALVFAIIEGGDKGWTAAITLGSFAAAIVVLGAWVMWEANTRHPMLDPKLFRRVPFRVGSLAITFSFASMFGAFFLLTQYFQFVHGLSPLSAGLRGLPSAAAMVLISPRSSNLVERFGKRNVMSVALAIQASGFAIFGLHQVDTPYWITFMAIVAMGAGMSLLMAPASEAIVSSVPPSRSGVGSAWNDTTREVGAALGIAVLGTILSTRYASGIESAVSGLPPELARQAREGIGATFAVAETSGADLIPDARRAFVDGMTLAYWTSAALSLALGLFVWIFYPNKGQEPGQATDEDLDPIAV